MAPGVWQDLQTAVAGRLIGPPNGTTNILFEWYDPLNQIPNQPSVWEDYALTSNGTSYLPALAVDSDGTAVVVWVSKPTAQSVLGSIWYTYQTSVNCSYCWSTP